MNKEIILNNDVFLPFSDSSIDSLEFIVLIAKVEEYFNIELEVEEIEKIHCFFDLYTIIEDKLNHSVFQIYIKNDLIISKYNESNNEDKYAVIISKNNELITITKSEYDFLNTFNNAMPLVQVSRTNKVIESLINNNILFIDIEEQENITNKNIRFIELKEITLEITEKCNLRCKHCVNDKILVNEHMNEIDFEILSQLFYNLSLWRIESLQLSGGEPLYHKDIKKIVIELAKYSFKVFIFTNALLIDKELLEIIQESNRFRENKIELRLSIDGMKYSHEIIRGKNTFTCLLTKLDLIQKYNIPIPCIETMAIRENYEEIEELILLCIHYKIPSIYVHPIYNFSIELESKFELTLDERKKYYKKMDILKEKYQSKINIIYEDVYFPIHVFDSKNTKKLKVINFLEKNKITNCKAGTNNMFISAKGECYPCLLYKGSEQDYCGNIKNETILEIWTSKGFDRSREVIKKEKLKECNQCKIFDLCFSTIKKCRIACEIMTSDYWGASKLCKKYKKELKDEVENAKNSIS